MSNMKNFIFFPKTIKFPEITINDFLTQAATDITSLLAHPPTSTIPSLQAGNHTKILFYR